ncbi:virulence associated protein E [Caudoviricetes sp.]|nr:virulence associated protein E [Caudoviricetes sp.]
MPPSTKTKTGVLNMLNTALEAASKGFHVFQVAAGRKAPPLLAEFPELSTRDPALIRQWWGERPQANVGLSTTRYGDHEALIVVDVDNKNGKNGSEEIKRLKKEGLTFPPTYSQTTPTGGYHIVYKAKCPVKQGVSVLGNGLDIRSRGGYIVGAGSLVGGVAYEGSSLEVVDAPDWLIDRLTKLPNRKFELIQSPPPGINTDYAKERAIHYLEYEAPISIKGDGGDATAYKVACMVKDFGVSGDVCLELMLDHWNDRCPPGWRPERLKEKVDHAYKYGELTVGTAAPEAHFEKIVSAETSNPKDQAPSGSEISPLEKLNREYAFVIAGGSGHILQETFDERGNPCLEHLDQKTFHDKLLFWTRNSGSKNTPWTKIWMAWARRRSFNKIVFRPGSEVPPDFYNLWKGFNATVFLEGEKVPALAQEAFAMFMEHALDNICLGHKEHFRWLMGHYAHIFQFPGVKPSVATVFKGKKGVGKNSLVETVGELLGSYFHLTAEREDVVGKFRGHLESCLLLVLDEAFWSGDKQGEGVLKHLITGKKHRIEHKGKNKYEVENFTRVCLISNDEWVVPASQDERRFAVFEVGDGRIGDTAYFIKMKEGMEAGGYKLLLDYFLKFDLSGININVAPSTKGLAKQKLESLEPFERWWVDCLFEGVILGGEHSDEWPSEISGRSFQNSYMEYHKRMNFRSRILANNKMGEKIKEFHPRKVDARFKDPHFGQKVVKGYRLGTLEEAKLDYESHARGKIDWW